MLAQEGPCRENSRPEVACCVLALVPRNRQENRYRLLPIETIIDCRTEELKLGTADKDRRSHCVFRQSEESSTAFSGSNRTLPIAHCNQQSRSVALLVRLTHVVETAWWRNEGGLREQPFNRLAVGKLVGVAGEVRHLLFAGTCDSLCLRGMGQPLSACGSRSATAIRATSRPSRTTGTSWPGWKTAQRR